MLSSPTPVSRRELRPFFSGGGGWQAIMEVIAPQLVSTGREFLYKLSAVCSDARRLRLDIFRPGFPTKGFTFSLFALGAGTA